VGVPFVAKVGVPFVVWLAAVLLSYQ